MDRRELRALIRDRREKISVIQAAELSARIAERVLTLPEYRQAKKVMCYASVIGEVNTAPLNARILEDGKELFLPKISKEKGRMVAVPVKDLASLRRGRMGIPEPPKGEGADPMGIDLILVPGIAFDRKGGRVGFGGGYYDRFLPETKALRVALAFNMQLVEDTHPEPHDQSVDMLITEDALLDFRGGNSL